MSKDDKSTYYDAGGIETLDIIKAKLTPEQYEGYLLGNALKYQCRMNFKTPDSPQRDAEKAANYSRYLAEFLAEYCNSHIQEPPKPEAKFYLNACDVPKGSTHYRAVDGGIRFYRLSGGCVKSKTSCGWGVTLDGNNINAWLKKVTPIT